MFKPVAVLAGNNNHAGQHICDGRLDTFYEIQNSEVKVSIDLIDYYEVYGLDIYPKDHQKDDIKDVTFSLWNKHPFLHDGNNDFDLCTNYIGPPSADKKYTTIFCKKGGATGRYFYIYRTTTPSFIVVEIMLWGNLVKTGTSFFFFLF